VLDSHARLPENSTLTKTAMEQPVMLAHTDDADAAGLDALRAKGCETLRLTSLHGRADVDALLVELGRRSMTNVLVEGGSAVLGSFLDARAIDEVHVFVAPILAGGKNALMPVGGMGVEKIADTLALSEWRSEMIGNNIAIHGRLNP
jgi:diaminohydroxyphosphoribosylaminopyrimidine deaminase/5-amino-6-(5-phosphoribosylamino)uracil reductase